MNKQPRILIISPLTYKKSSVSRTLDSYFRLFNKENLMQIYSNSQPPFKGHCSVFYQITDKRLIKRRFSKNIKVGIEYLDSNLMNESDYITNLKSFKPFYKGPLYRLIRKQVWKKRYWNEPELEKTVDDFKPDYIFINFYKDFYLFDIALHFSEKHNLPIILCITDDYLFYDQYKFQPFNFTFKKLFNKVIKKILERTTLCIYCSEKIKEKYTKNLGIKGEVIYLGSDIEPKLTTEINLKKDWYYFGTLEYGRLNSLLDIGHTLAKNNSSIVLHVYSNDVSKEKMVGKNLFLHKAISYDGIAKLDDKVGCLVVVEDFKEKNVNMVSCSLSAKVGDTLCKGKPILAYGDIQTGLIEFMKTNEVAYCATSKKELDELIAKLLAGYNDAKIYSNQFELAKKNFNVDKESMKFLDLITCIE